MELYQIILHIAFWGQNADLRYDLYVCRGTGSMNRISVIQSRIALVRCCVTLHHKINFFINLTRMRQHILQRQVYILRSFGPTFNVCHVEKISRTGERVMKLSLVQKQYLFSECTILGFSSIRRTWMPRKAIGTFRTLPFCLLCRLCICLPQIPLADRVRQKSGSAALVHVVLGQTLKFKFKFKFKNIYFTTVQSMRG